MRKYKILISCMLCLVLSFSMVTPAFALGRQPIQPMAWPGRPGGNGDGSEEWLTGSYGEMNGPWKLSHHEEGTVSDFNDAITKIEFVKGIFLSALLGYYKMIDVSLKILSNIATVYNLVSPLLPNNKLVGRYYYCDIYVSGRRMKMVIRTYWGKNKTDFEKEYVNEYAW